MTEVAKSAVERLKKKLDQKAAQRTEQEQADEIDQARRAVREPDPDEIDPGVAADLEAAGESRSIRDPKGLFVMGNPGGPGRPPGSKDSFPRNSYRAMRELIAGRIMKAMKDEEGKDVQRSAAEIMAEVILEGMLGNLVLSQTDKSTTYANPLHAVKLYQDYMLKARELAVKVAELKKKEKGVGGGIRIVLPSPVVDPLLRPGQKPRPLRLLGQDPSKPIEHYQDQDRRQGTESCTRTASHEPRVAPATNARGDVAQKRETSQQPRAISPSAPEPEDFEAQLIDDFEHPICYLCMGAKIVRDPEFGIKMVDCDYCGGAGRAPAPE